MDNLHNDVAKRPFQVKWGIIAGVVGLAVLAYQYATGNHLSSSGHWSTWVSMVASVIIIHLAVSDYKKANRSLTLGQGIKVGLGVALIAGLFTLVWFLLLGYVLEPNLSAEIMEFARSQNPEDFAQLDAMPEDQRQAAMAVSEFFTSPFMMGTVGLLSSLFFGLIISLITSLIQKTQ